MLSRANEDQRERIEDALAPPNEINPETGVPYWWGDEDRELANLDSLLTM